MELFEISDKCLDEYSFHKFMMELPEETVKNFYNFENKEPREINEIIDDGRFNFFLRIENKIAGYGFLKEKERNNNIVNFGLVIGPHYQNKGYGKLLLEYIINWAHTKEYKKIWGACFDDNKPALRLYKKLGFRFEGVFLNEERIYDYSTDKQTFRHLYSLAIYLGRNEGSTYYTNIEYLKKLYENM